MGSDLTAADRLCVTTLRTLAMDAVEEAKSGHPGAPMGLAVVAEVLWSRYLKFDPEDPGWPDRDRFILSCGHASMLLYGLLHLAGYAVGLDDLRRFRQWGSNTPGHPEHGLTPGVEATTGPLGQGLGNAVGMALAERMLAARFNTSGCAVVDHRTWVLASDGDLMEGVAAEASSLAGHLGLGRLCVVYDDNRITIEGETSLAFSEDVGRRYEAYGWHVQHVDGLDAGEVDAALAAAVAETGRPSLIVARTHIAFGAPTKQDTAESHGAPLGAAEVRGAKLAYGCDPEARFQVPPGAGEPLRRRAAAGADARSAWLKRVECLRSGAPDVAASFERQMAGRLPEGWDGNLPTWPADGRRVATRKASGQTLVALAARLPELVGGSADLAPSNNTLLPEGGSVAAGNFAARNLHFGVREHAMGAMLNGLALHGGLRPFGGTFLIFSDYMRPSIRLAALMRLPVIYVFTHDSIGLGEDGPTHQPVEHLAALRAIPGLSVIRPADATETAESWRLALARTDGPTALVLTRQDLPVLDRTRLAPAAGVARGGYVLAEAAGGRPAIVLVATGSEVDVALRARTLLEADGTPTRVVSLPCWDRFAGQPRAWREEVLPGGLPKLAVEAGASFGWERWVGTSGAMVAIDHFGASAPGGELLRRFGFTPEQVVRHARALLGLDEATPA